MSRIKPGTMGKIILFIISSILIIALIFPLSACGNTADESVVTETEEAEEIQEEDTEETAEETGQETIETTEEEPAEVDQEPVDEEEPEEEVIPEEIANKIEEANSYYENSEFGMAVSAFRRIQIAIEDSELSDTLKSEILLDVNAKYEDSEEIVTIARMHYANAKQLEYEKRFEEAKNELTAALEIYPKYQDAIDELAAIETLEELG